MRCAKCGLDNPDNSIKCKCGFEFNNKNSKETENIKKTIQLPDTAFGIYFAIFTIILSLTDVLNQVSYSSGISALSATWSIPFTIFMGGYFFYCIYKIHKVVLSIETNYKITPAKVIVYSFIPVYNIVWMYKWTSSLVLFCYSKSNRTLSYNKYKYANHILLSVLYSLIISVIFTVVLTELFKDTFDTLTMYLSITPFVWFIILNKLRSEISDSFALETKNHFGFALVQKKLEYDFGESQPIRNFSALFNRKHFGINYYMGFGFLIASILTYFVSNYFNFMTWRIPIKFPSTFFFSSVILSTALLVALIHVIKKDWLLILVYGISFTLLNEFLDLIFGGELYFELDILMRSFLLAFLFMTGFVVTIRLWGPMFGSLLIGFVVAFFLYQVALFLLSLQTINIYFIVLVIYESLFFATLIYIGFALHLWQKGFVLYRSAIVKRVV